MSVEADVDVVSAMPTVEAQPVVPMIPLPLNASVSGSCSVVTANFALSEQLSTDQLYRLRKQGYPDGLAHELGSTRRAFPLRFWVVDNSGSMRSPDGHRVVGTDDNIQVVPCNRWTELQNAVAFHAELAGLLQVTTVFRMLNDPGVTAGPQEFSVAEDVNQAPLTTQQDVERVQQVIENCEPRGVTPLTEHLLEIRRRVESIEGVLRSQGQQAVIVLATDGIPSDKFGKCNDSVKEEFVTALQELQALPIWIVIRLCTDDDEVVEYYNELDSILELPLEVIDDFFGEGKEIHGANKWLNYALPLHRIREQGYHHTIFDLLDERLLNKDELSEFVQLMFGKESFAEAPNVHTDWKGFCAVLSTIVKAEGKQWNPNKRKMDYWIDLKELDRAYGGGFRLFRSIRSSFRHNNDRAIAAP